MSIDIIPTAAVLGAEIRGVDLARPLDDLTFSEIERAFNAHAVISSVTSELRPHSRSPSPAALVRSNSTSSASDGACPAAQRL